MQGNKKPQNSEFVEKFHGWTWDPHCNFRFYAFLHGDLTHSNYTCEISKRMKWVIDSLFNLVAACA